MNRFQRRQAKRAQRALLPNTTHLVKVAHPIVKLGSLVDVVEYDAILRVEFDGRTVLDTYRGESLNKIARVREHFPTLRLSRYTWQISGIPVYLSRHTQGRTMTRRVMDHLGYQSGGGEETV